MPGPEGKGSQAPRGAHLLDSVDAWPIGRRPELGPLKLRAQGPPLFPGLRGYNLAPHVSRLSLADIQSKLNGQMRGYLIKIWDNYLEGHIASRKRETEGRATNFYSTFCT